MSDYGFRVSKAGYDALTDGDANMAFTSKRFSDKVIAYGTASAVLNGGAGATNGVIITHGLGYAPQGLLYDFNPGPDAQSVIIPLAWRNYQGTGATVTVDAVIDSNHITVTWKVVSGSVSNITVEVVYFIFDSAI